MPLDFNFDTVLVTSIDKLLKRNRITKVSSLDIVLEDFEDESRVRLPWLSGQSQKL